MRCTLLLALLAAGCNQIYDLDETRMVDASTAPDRDDDGIADLADNCPLVPNPPQSDEDLDAIGDACDNCPLVPNTPQTTNGDGDAVGDACDPRPTTDGDCLILIDSFTDPATFSERWEVFASSPSAVVEPAAGEVRIVPVTFLTIVARDGGAVLAGTFDVEVKARIDLRTGGALHAVSNATAPRTGYGCGVSAAQPIPFAAASVGTATYGSGLSSAPVGEDLLLRLVTHDVALAYPRVNCRVDYGFAVGNHDFANPAILERSGGGVAGETVPAVVEAVALYEPRTPCPAPIVR